MGVKCEKSEAKRGLERGLVLARSDRTKHIEEAIHVIEIDQEKGGEQPRSQGLFPGKPGKRHREVKK